MTEGDGRSVAYRGPLARALGSALTAASTSGQSKPEDAAAVALARRYAALIDDAAVAAKYREPLAVLRRAVAFYGEDDAVKALDKIADALGAHSVASDLGPKLLAALTALGMTAAGRGARGGESGGPGVGIAARLDEFTAARARKHPA